MGKFVFLCISSLLLSCEVVKAQFWLPAANILNTLTGGVGDVLLNGQYPQDQQNTPNNYQPNNFQAQQNFIASSSVCNDIFSYQNDNSGTFGLIKIINPDRVRNMLKLKLSLGAKLTNKFYGSVTIQNTEKAVYDITNGQPIYYRVTFPIQNPLPKPTEIYLNDQLLCTGPDESGQSVTSITLSHNFVTGLSSSSYPQKPVSQTGNQYATTAAHQWVPPQKTTVQPPKQTTRTTRQITRQTTQKYSVPTTTFTPQNIETDFECGVSEVKPPNFTGLVVNGRTASRGQFPWLAAYFHNGQDFNGFICGGSLISTKLIVTAAHCVREKNNPLTRKAEEATFYLGKYNLESFSGEQNFIVTPVEKFVVNPEWKTDEDRYDADIAIAVLSRTILFSKFVKPICIWTSTQNYEDLVGKTAVVAGWGKTENNAVTTTTPKWAEIPVVNLVTCIQSHHTLAVITSSRTFCAGNIIDGIGPCNGDSGGGLMAKNSNKWYLRGVVSSSLYDNVLSSCDTKNYAVYTDVSKFTGWIQGFVQTYG